MAPAVVLSESEAIISLGAFAAADELHAVQCPLVHAPVASLTLLFPMVPAGVTAAGW